MLGALLQLGALSARLVRMGYLATSRQYGNALLAVPHQEEEAHLSPRLCLRVFVGAILSARYCPRAVVGAQLSCAFKSMNQFLWGNCGASPPQLFGHGGDRPHGVGTYGHTQEL